MHASRLRDERGGILVLSAVLIPLFLLMTALVVDGGNWFVHKRQLQTRADAGALAAGVEYINQIEDCFASSVSTGTAIADVAKRFAGTDDGAVTGTKYNQDIAKQSNLTVAVNASNATSADGSDGGNPCDDHATGDSISPNGGIWTDVKVRESNLGTLFGAFGLDLPSVTAQARVEVKQVIGVRERGLPFINETGDQIECVWAKFVRARDGVANGFTVTPSNPIPLTETSPGTWTGNVSNLQFTNANDDIAIQYYAGSKDGNAPCDFSSDNKGPLPHQLDDDRQPVQIDWLNVYDTGAAPAADSAPKLRLFSLTSNTCGGPGFLYTASTDPAEQCRVGFTAIIDTGVNNVTGEITVQPQGTAVDPVTVSFDTTGSNPNLATVTGTITILANETQTGTGYSQDYTQTGTTYFSVGWEQTSGRVGNGAQGNCVTGGNNCKGTFQGETVSGLASNVQQATYMADPLGSTPLVGTSLSLAATSFPAGGQTGAFTITFQHQAVDKEHVVLVRDSVQSSGNRTKAIYCGNGPGKGAQALENAVIDGCAKDLVLNTRNDSCSPAPASATSQWDCVQLEQGNKSSIAKGAEERFDCTDNNWVTGGPLPPDGDPRWAYIILTGYGRTFAAANNDWLPIEGLLRVYITGWDRQGGGGGPASCAENEDPPRGYDTKGAQFWGHLVSPITLDPAVIVGEAKCDTSLGNIQCSPGLVR